MTGDGGLAGARSAAERIATVLAALDGGEISVADARNAVDGIERSTGWTLSQTGRSGVRRAQRAAA